MTIESIYQSTNYSKISNTVNSQPDYNFWRQKEVWLLPEAAKLICGRDPVSRYAGRPIFNTKFKTIDIIDKSYAAVNEGKLRAVRTALIPNHVLVEPKDFLYWATSEGFQIPEPLQGLERQAPVQQVVHTSEEILKERFVTVARTLWELNPKLSFEEVCSHKVLKKIMGDDRVCEDTAAAWLKEYR